MPSGTLESPIEDITEFNEKVEIKSDDLDCITILTAVKGLHNFLPLWLMNIRHQQYPQDKITVIVDECDCDESFIDNEYHCKAMLYPAKLKVMRHKETLSMGEKRNRLVDACETDVFCFMEADDMYQPNHLIYSRWMMKEHKKGSVASLDLIFAFPEHKKKPYAMSYNKDLTGFPNVSTMMMTKELFSKTKGFKHIDVCEDFQVWDGVKDDVFHTEVINQSLCIVHKDKRINMEHCLREETLCKDANIDGGLKDFLDCILRISRDDKDTSSTDLNID